PAKTAGQRELCTFAVAGITFVDIALCCRLANPSSVLRKTPPHQEMAMSRCLTATLVVLGLVTLTSRDAAAQSDKDIAAYAGLNGTPVGALSPIMVSTGTKGEKPFNSIVGRYSHYSPNGGGDGNNQFGATWFHKAGTNAAVSGTVGYLAPGCTGC